MPIIKLPGGSLRDEIREPLYDTLDINNSDTIQAVRSFFANVQGKSKTLSNLRQNSALETAVSFRIQGLAIDAQNFEDANSSALPIIMEHSSAALRVGEKVYWEGPMRFAAGRLFTDVAGGTAKVYQQHGAAAVAAVILQGRHVVDINPLQSFQVDWNIDGMTAADLVLAEPAPATKLRYVCSLKGLKRRPVQ